MEGRERRLLLNNHGMLTALDVAAWSVPWSLFLSRLYIFPLLWVRRLGDSEGRLVGRGGGRGGGGGRSCVREGLCAAFEVQLDFTILELMLILLLLYCSVCTVLYVSRKKFECSRTAYAQTTHTPFPHSCWGRDHEDMPEACLAVSGWSRGLTEGWREASNWIDNNNE